MSNNIAKVKNSNLYVTLSLLQSVKVGLGIGLGFAAAWEVLTVVITVLRAFTETVPPL